MGRCQSRDLIAGMNDHIGDTVGTVGIQMRAQAIRDPDLNLESLINIEQWVHSPGCLAVLPGFVDCGWRFLSQVLFLMGVFRVPHGP